MPSPMRSQQGIALVQVLLISAILLLFVVQLSKESREQVRDSLLLKKRTEAHMEIQSTMQELQFALLTQERSRGKIAFSRQTILFSGESVEVKPGLKVTLQDEAGLVSLPYGGDMLQYMGLSTRDLEWLAQWQGTSIQTSDASFRSGVLPSLKELPLLPGFQNVTLEGLTHIPTRFFSISLAPDDVLEQLVNPDIIEEVKRIRHSGDQGARLQELTGLDYSMLGMTGSSGVLQVNIESTTFPYMFRSQRFEIQSDYVEPILALGL